MILSGLVTFAVPVIADETLPGDAGIDAQWVDTWMCDDPALVDQDEPLIFNYDVTGTSLYYLGDDESIISINFQNGGTDMDIDTDVTMTLTVGTGNTLITVGDDSTQGWTPAAGTSAWLADAWLTGVFTIDIGDAGAVETTYPMRVGIQYTLAGSVENNYLTFEVYVSSVMHDDASDATRDTAHEMTYDSGDYIIDNSVGGDDAFEAGDDFKEASYDLNNYAGFAITDPKLTLTAPAGFTLVEAYAQFMGDIAANADETLLWRLNVAARTLPGVYQGNATLTYQRDVGGLVKDIAEGQRTIEYTVDYNFKDNDPVVDGEAYSIFQCYASAVTIVEDSARQVDYVAPYDIPSLEQSTYTDRIIQIEVTITNNGNSNLRNMQARLDPDTAAWDYFRNPRFFWEDINAGTPAYDTISNTFDLNIGATATFAIEVIVDARIPIGEHRLPIIYDGFYFDNGALGGSTGFMGINGGNGIADNVDNLEIIFSIFVTDSVIQCHVDNVDTSVGTGEVGDKDDIRAEEVIVTIVNDEEYNFIDVIVRANFTGTPWYMPIIDMRDPWVDAIDANAAQPFALWTPTTNLVATFPVDTDPSYTPDRYPFQLEITAVIEETLEVVTVIVDYTQGAVVDFTGYGPDVYITAFTADDIIPGQDFELNMTIQNVGDDTLRDVTIMIWTDGTYEYDWDLEQEFKAQFDWTAVYENWMDVSGPVEIPDDMFYTVDDLDVDNIKEIVEINLYMDGVYSQPAARIEVIHINDLAPGASTNVVFDMITDKDMVNGKPYDFEVMIDGIDTDGVAYSVDRWITVQSSLPGDSYNPVELNWFDAGLKALALFLFFIIVLAILLFVYNMFKGEPYDEDEEDFDFEDEPMEPETPAESEKKDDLVEP